MQIVIDHRERASGVVDVLAAQSGVTISVQRLPAFFTLILQSGKCILISLQGVTNGCEKPAGVAFDG